MASNTSRGNGDNMQYASDGGSESMFRTPCESIASDRACRSPLWNQLWVIDGPFPPVRKLMREHLRL